MFLQSLVILRYVQHYSQAVTAWGLMNKPHLEVILCCLHLLPYFLPHHLGSHIFVFVADMVYIDKVQLGRLHMFLHAVALCRKSEEHGSRQFLLCLGVALLVVTHQFPCAWCFAECMECISRHWLRTIIPHTVNITVYSFHCHCFTDYRYYCRS